MKFRFGKLKNRYKYILYASEKFYDTQIWGL